jgi:hypothetical protein
MEFQRGLPYEIRYKNLKKSKVGTYLCSSGGVNIFFDINGEFGVSDEFIKKGHVDIEEVPDI